MESKPQRLRLAALNAEIARGVVAALALMLLLETGPNIGGFDCTKLTFGGCSGGGGAGNTTYFQKPSTCTLSDQDGRVVAQWPARASDQHCHMEDRP